MSNSGLLLAINQSIAKHRRALSRHNLSVGIGYVLRGVFVTKDYRAAHASNYDGAKEEGRVLERRVCALLSEGDITPDCCLMKINDNTTIGVAIGGQADITTQSKLAVAIATDIATHYQELRE